MDYKKYSIYDAIVYFEEINDYKKRPVLLLENENKYEIFDIYKITHDDSNENKVKKKSNYKYNYPISKWKEAGLKEPSLIKIRQINNIDKKLLIDYLGDLQKEDIEGLENLIVQMYEDDKNALEKYNAKTENKIEIPDEVIKQMQKK